MKVKNLTATVSYALIGGTVISYALIGGTVISYCLAQSQHLKPHAGATTVRIGPYDPARQARLQQYESLVELGQRLLASDPQVAEAKFRAATAVDPYQTDAWMGLARASDAQGKPSQALSAYGRVFGSSGSGVYSTFPSDVEALARYGGLCEDAGQHEAALRACNQASERLNPKPKVPLGVPQDRQVASPELRAMLEVVRGVALDQQGKKGEALAAFNHAAGLQPNDARVQFYHGYGLRKAGQFAEAQAAFQKAAALDTAGTVKAAAGDNLRAVQAHLK